MFIFTIILFLLGSYCSQTYASDRSLPNIPRLSLSQFQNEAERVSVPRQNEVNWRQWQMVERESDMMVAEKHSEPLTVRHCVNKESFIKNGNRQRSLDRLEDFVGCCILLGYISVGTIVGCFVICLKMTLQSPN